MLQSLQPSHGGVNFILAQLYVGVYTGAAASSFSFFRAPLTAYQQVIEVVGTASKQSLENFQKAGESFEKAMQQGREQWEEAARRTAHSTEKPGK